MTKKIDYDPTIERTITLSTMITEGVLIGLVSGFSVVLYRKMLSLIDIVRGNAFMDFTSFKSLIWITLCVVFALIIGKLVTYSPDSAGSGVPVVLGEINGKKNMNGLKVAWTKFVGGGLSNLTGLSLGLEGPSIQIGAAMAKIIPYSNRKNKLSNMWRVTAGASAGMSAAFSAPITGVLFALEEMHGRFTPAIIVPCMIAASIADFLSKIVFGLDPIFQFNLTQSIPIHNYLIVIIFGIAIGFLGIGYNKLTIAFSDLFEHSKAGVKYWPVAAVVVTVVVGYFAYDLLGGGHHLLVEMASRPYHISILAMFLIGKILLTTLASGSKAHGGIFIPILCIGGLFGALYAQLLITLGVIPQVLYLNFIFLGMVGIVSSVIRSPLLAVILVVEVTGSFQYVLAFVLVSIIAYITAEALKNKPLYVALMERSGLISDDE